MIRLHVPDGVRAEAKRLAEPLAKRYANNSTSILSGKGHYYAKIGEIMAAQALGLKHVDTYQNDLEGLFMGRKGRRVEVKVKHRTVPPRANYYATVGFSLSLCGSVML